MKYIYSAIAIIVLFSSCKTQRMFTTLDILRPAEVTFSSDVKNVLIVNNATVQPYNVGHTTAGYEASESVRFDSAALFCNAGLREGLETKEFFTTVDMAQTNQNHSDNFYKISILSKDNVKFLCDLYKTDAVISLDHIQTEDEISRFYSDYGSVMSALDVKVTSTWSIHYPDNKASSFKQFEDEFSWESETLDDLPSRADALVDACILTGSNVAERMIPRWEKQDRYFYTPNNAAMQQAMDSVRYRKWRGAINLWQQASDQSNHYGLKYKAANNIAIAYEILGDTDKAVEYCELAIKLYPNIITFGISENEDIYTTINYLEFLKKRKNEVELIKNQLSE